MAKLVPSVVVLQSLSHVWLLAALWTAACQASLPFTISWSLLELMYIEWVMSSKHLTFCCSLLLPLSIVPSIRVFSSESALCIRWPEYWSFSYSISPSIVYSFRLDFLSDWLVWSPFCPREAQASSLAPQFESISSLVLSLLYGPTLTSVHDSWKNQGFDHTDLCQQSDVSAF